MILHCCRWLALALLLQLSTAWASDRIAIATGPESGTQFQVAGDLARYVGPAAGLDLEVLGGAGAGDSVPRLLDVPGVRMALLPADTAFAYADAARRGNADAIRLMAPIRVVAPLYRQIVYWVVRADAPFNSVHDIRDARINIGPVKSDSALTATTLYRLMFDAPIPEDHVSVLAPEAALAALTGDRSVDVVVLIGEQPMKLLANMRPEARHFIKLLKFDGADPTAAGALRVYDAATIPSAVYPNLLDENLAVLASPVYLVAYGPRREEDDVRLARFVKAWCQQLPRLRKDGLPLWQDVQLAPTELKPEWHYAQTAVRELAACSGSAAPAVPTTCSMQERVLGLCP